MTYRRRNWEHVTALVLVAVLIFATLIVAAGYSWFAVHEWFHEIMARK